MFETFWNDYRQRRNSYVPICFMTDEQVWTRLYGCAFRGFYTSPELHWKSQIAAQKWMRKNIPDDTCRSQDSPWEIRTVRWMEENEFFGVKVDYPVDEYAWGEPLDMEPNELLDHIASINTLETVEQSPAFRLYKEMVAQTMNREIDGRPIDILPRLSTDGIFTKACEIRGAQNLCIELVDHPEFVNKLLELMTTKIIERINAWKTLIGLDLAPSQDYFHFCDDSLQLISRKQYKEFVLPHHERLFTAMTIGERCLHLCGHSTQHFDLLHQELGVVEIDGPGAFADHADYLERFGSSFRFIAQLNNSVVATGSPEQLRSMVEKVLNRGAKLPGRFALHCFVTRETTLDRVLQTLTLCRQYGTIE